MKKHIENYYGLKVDAIEVYGDGQTSEIFRVISNFDSYILKSHLSEQTVANEFHCLEALSKIYLSAKPLRTVHNKIFFKLNGIVYILMTFINSQNINKTDIDYFELGKTISSMHSALSNLKLNDAPDRFNEEQLIHDIKSADIKQLIERNYYEYKDYTYNPSSNIHGDLGIWNLLFDNKKISIIDFGEARYGDPFFDLAAITESLNLDDNEAMNLLNGYGDSDNESVQHLTYIRKKWRLRGIIYLVVNQLKTESEIYDLIKHENI